MPKCVVSGCLARSEEGFVLFRFPSEKRDAGRHELWVQKIGRKDWQPKLESRICELHFEDGAWMVVDGVVTKSLKSEAVPTIFPSPSRLPRRRCIINRRETAGISPSPRKRVRLLHAYAKSPSKMPPVEDSSADSDDSATSPKPLSKNDNPGDVVRIHGFRAGSVTVTMSPSAPTSVAGETEIFLPTTTAPKDSPKSKTTPKDSPKSKTTPKDSPKSKTTPKASSQAKKRLFVCSPTPRKLKREHEHYRCTCNRLRIENKRLRSQLSRAQKKLAKQHVRAQRTKEGEALRQVFNEDQILNLTRKTRRVKKWSKATLKKAFKLRFSCGMSGYKELIAQNLPLPSIRTLNRRIEHLKFDSGILYEVIEQLAVKVKAMKEKERDCVLVLDEMSITGSTEFDVSTGSILGEVTLPEHSGIATHALTFMVAGLNSRWKQTIAYYYTGDSTDGSVLKKIILELIKLCENIQLKVRAVTSDQGPVNQALWQAFGMSCTREFIKKKGREEKIRKVTTKNWIPHPENDTRKLFFIWDAPHLLKNFRGMLVKHRVIAFSQEIATAAGLPSRKAELKHLLELCDYQGDKELQLHHKMKKTFLQPSHFQKMNVYEAYQVLHRNVAAGLEILVTEKKGEKEMLTTAWLLRQVNRWFDLMTSRCHSLALSKNNMTAYNEAIKFLEDFIELIKSLEFGEKLDTSWKPIQAGMISTTTSVLELQKILLDEDNYEFVLTGRLTQDCLENLFSVVRKRQRKPSCLQFKRHLKTITVAQYITPVSSSNYDQDDSEFLGEFFETRIKKDKEEEENENQEELDLQELINGNFVQLDVGEENSLYNLAGYIAYSVEKNYKICEACLEGIKCKPGEEIELMPYNKLLKLKEYKEGLLIAVNKECFRMFQLMEETFRRSQIIFLATPSLKDFLEKVLLNKVKSFIFLNCHNIKEKLVKRFVTCRLRMYCKFQAPKKENIDYSSKSGIIKTLLQNVRKDEKAQKKAKAARKPTAAQSSKAAV